MTIEEQGRAVLLDERREMTDVKAITAGTGWRPLRDRAPLWLTETGSRGLPAWLRRVSWGTANDGSTAG